jgi:hypothetical protein
MNRDQRPQIGKPNRGRDKRSRMRRRLVELRGIEPLTSAVRLQRSPI